MALDPTLWEDLLTYPVDGQAVDLVRPADTTGPCWAAYDNGTHLGTLTAELHSDAPVWRTQSAHETFDSLEDAVRALRRPASWPRDRIKASLWARELLTDKTLTAVDVETTGLSQAWAVQVAAVDRDGTVLFSEDMNPRAEIEPGAIALHGITPQRIRHSLGFGDLVPDLAQVLHGRTIISYNAEFDTDVLARELTRHLGTTEAARQWMAACRWHNALVPYAEWRGLWSVNRGAYRIQRLGGPHDAVADCRMLLGKLQLMARTASC